MHISRLPLLPVYLLLIFGNSLLALLSANTSPHSAAHCDHLAILGRLSGVVNRRQVLMCAFLLSQLMINIVCFAIWHSCALQSVDMGAFIDDTKGESMLSELAWTLPVEELACKQRRFDVSPRLRAAYEGNASWDSALEKAFLVSCQERHRHQ